MRMGFAEAVADAEQLAHVMATHPFPDWLSPAIREFYAEKCAISSLFDWQHAILRDADDDAQNLVFSAPTSAGKSLVAELLAWRVAKMRRRKVLFVLPYVSVAREKLHILQKCWRRDDVAVAGFIGPHASNPNEWMAAICTIEKAAGLINRALSEDWFNEIGMIVVDELHMIYDGNRGAHIDHMLSKILYWNLKQQEQVDKIRIIGMSATIPQIEKLGDWLDAKVHRAQFRPVELVENIIVGQKMRQIRGATIGDDIVRHFDDALIDLASESFCDATSTLIMCSSKIEVENVACQLARKFSELKKQRPEIVKNRMDGLIYTRSGLERNGCKDGNLIGVLGLTIAFHHAGLTLEERDCVEQGFRDGHILVLVATSTLASGVNLPAERVIIKSQTRGPSAINSMTYRQMIGRAGRMGHAKKGESFLIVRPSDEANIQQAIFTPIDQISTISNNNNKSIDISRFILEAIATGLTHNQLEIDELTGKLLISSKDGSEEVVEKLKCESFIATNDVGEILEATQLGKAAMASALPPDAALSIFEDLSVAKQAIVLDTELHMLYLVTPINVTVWQECDWHHLFEIFTRIPAEHRRVAKLIGVDEKYLVDRMRSGGGGAAKEEQRLKTHIRFFSTLALFDLINEVDIHRVSMKYRIPRGSLQTLQSQSATYAGMIVAFCSRLGWTYLKSLLDGFAMRLYFGIRSELSELVAVDGIDATRARVLHEKGVTSLANLVACDSQKLAHFLTLAVPYCRSDSNDGKGEWLFGEPRIPLAEAATTLKTRAKQRLMARINELGLSVKIVETTTQQPDEITVDSGIGESVKIEDENELIDQCTQSMTEMSIVSDNEEEEKDVESLDTSLMKMEVSTKVRAQLSHVFQFSQPAAAEQDSFDLPVPGSIPIDESILASEKSFDVFATPPPTAAQPRVTLKHSRISYMVNSPNYISSPIQKHPKIDIFHLEPSPTEILQRFDGKWLSLSIDKDNFGIAISCEIGTFYVSFADNFKEIKYNGQNSECFGNLLESCASLENRKKLRELLENENICKYIYRLEDCYEIVEDFGIEIKNVKILNALMFFNNILELGNDEFHKCFEICENWNFDISGIYQNSSGVFRKSIEAYAIFRIFETFSRNSMEEKCTNLILKMYLDGIPIDRKTLKSCVKMIRREIEELEEQCWKLAHGEFNLESSQNVYCILFKRLGLIYPEGQKSGTGKVVLEEILDQHPIVEKIIKYRHLKYTITQCLVPIENALNHKSSRIRCHYDILTSTGRIITSSPNIQNIPKRESLNGVCIRSLVKCAPHFCLIAADYSQLELRVLAHLSGDDRLIEMIRSNCDIFEDLAEKWRFSRDAVKQLCYGLIYGMGTRSLAELTKLTSDEAEHLYKSFFEMFPKVRSFINQTKEDAIKKGFVETILGRKRITKLNMFGEEKCREERVLVNFTIQGSASEIFKTAIVDMSEKFEGLNARIILTIHDEVLVEAEKSEKLKIAKIIRVAMENSLKEILRVPMSVKIKCGSNWAEMKEIL